MAQISFEVTEQDNALLVAAAQKANMPLGNFMVEQCRVKMGEVAAAQKEQRAKIIDSLPPEKLAEHDAWLEANRPKAAGVVEGELEEAKALE